MNEKFEHIEPDEQDFFLNKKTDKIYVSKPFNITQLNPKDGFTEQLRPVWYVSRVVECGQNQFVKDRNEIVLRETPNARQEIVAKIFDDIRGVITLQIQKISTKTGNPHEKTYFTFSQFVNENGINEEKFSSFELFRKNIVNPEIITFDELYERAKHIIQNPLKEWYHVASVQTSKFSLCAEFTSAQTMKTVLNKTV